jgi:hypothetical protein
MLLGPRYRFLISVLAVLAGCSGPSSSGRVALLQGKISLIPPKSWMVSENSESGALMIGPGGRLSAAVLDAPASVDEPRQLVEDMKGIYADLSIVSEKDFPAAKATGKEFVVSLGAGQTGAVYILQGGGSLCILTFSSSGAMDENRIRDWRATVKSLEFKTGAAGDNKSLQGGN